MAVLCHLTQSQFFPMDSGQGFPTNSKIGGDVALRSFLLDIRVSFNKHFVPFLWSLGAQKKRSFLAQKIVLLGYDTAK